jgi:hypothetical protein
MDAFHDMERYSLSWHAVPPNLGYIGVNVKCQQHLSPAFICVPDCMRRGFRRASRHHALPPQGIWN